jgi:hypothetical protein
MRRHLNPAVLRDKLLVVHVWDQKNPYKRNRTAGQFQGFITQTLAFAPFHCRTVETPPKFNQHQCKLEEVVSRPFFLTSMLADHHREQPPLPSFGVKALPSQALFETAPFSANSLVRIHVAPASL